MGAGDPFAELPIVIRHRPGRVLWRVLQLIVLVIYGVILVSSQNRFDDEPMLLVAGICGGACLLLEVALRLRARFATAVYTIDRTGVQGSVGGRQWREPLSAYEGVLWREVYRYKPNAGDVDALGTQRISLLELRHRVDGDRTIQLLRRKSRDGVRACWETAATSLNLPALRELPDGEITRREPDELDKSLRELAREGRLELPRLGLPSPPADVDWQAAMPGQARVRQEATYLLIIFIASFVIPLIGLVALMLGGSALLLVLAAAPLAGHVYRRRSGFQVDIAGRELRIRVMLGGTALRTWRLPIDEIEQVWAAPVIPAYVERELGEVWIESDRRSVRIVPLSRPAADWLVQFIRTVVVKAPGRS